MPKNQDKIKNYGPTDRKAMEADEKDPAINTDMPESRMSTKIQVPDVKDMETKGDTPVAPSLTADKIKTLHNSLSVQPTSGASLDESPKLGGMSSGEGAAVVFSAAGAAKYPSPVNDASRIPYNVGGYRPDTRSGKATSDTDFIINNGVCEQIRVEFKGTKDLGSSGSEKQGYNGRKQFKSSRGKKTGGVLPQSTLFDRSIDFERHDEVVHTTGQVLDTIDPTSSYPTVTAKLSEDGFSIIDVAIETPMHKSNYLLKDFHFEIKNGKIAKVGFNEDEIISHANAVAASEANVNWQVDRNNVAKSVIKLQYELGRETSEKWSPLGYVIKQPYQYNMLAHDIEAVTGAIMTTAYRAATTSVAFCSHNLLAKDGSKPVTPIVEMFLQGQGVLPASLEDSELEGSLDDIIFKAENLRDGSAAAIIKMFDSTPKYATKANFFNMPKSLKYFVQMCDNNISPLHAKKEFMMALDTAHVFSTVDGNYNPMLPIFATDKISLVNPLRLGKFLEGWNRDAVTANNPSGCADVYAYGYKDQRNNYYQSLRHPLVEGLMKWMVQHEANLVKAYGDNTTVTIPAYFSMLYPGMFQFMLCAASQDVLLMRNLYFRDFLFAGDQSEYIWPDLASLSSLNPKYSRNMTITDYKTALQIGKLSDASFIRLMFGENYDVVASYNPAVGTKKTALAMPWYFNENSFSGSYTAYSGFKKDDDSEYGMSYPELRPGVTHQYLERLYDLSERDLRLCLDRMVDIPVHCTSTAIQSVGDSVENKGNKYVPITIDDAYHSDDIRGKIIPRALRYDINSDGRVIVEYENNATKPVLPNKAGSLAVPRELGFLLGIHSAQPVLTNVTIDRSGEVTWGQSGNYRLSSMIDGSNSHRLISYQASGEVNTVNISRANALVQNFTTYFADRSEGLKQYNDDYTTIVGIVPCLSAMFNNASTENNEIDLKVSDHGYAEGAFFAVGGSGDIKIQDNSKVFTMAAYMWSMLSRMFLPINYFENSTHTIKDADLDKIATAGVYIDSMETAFYFGVAGFFESDFSVDILNRSNIIDMSGIEYTEDEFIKSSPVFRV